MSDLLTKKSLQKLCSIFEGMYEKKRVLKVLLRRNFDFFFFFTFRDR